MSPHLNEWGVVSLIAQSIYKRKEVKTMNYGKPEVTNVAGAIAAVQSQGASKLNPLYQDFEAGQPKATSMAYESDE
jgi:hypothetical protein